MGKVGRREQWKVLNAGLLKGTLSNIYMKTRKQCRGDACSGTLDVTPPIRSISKWTEEQGGVVTRNRELT